jgi:hypothetical protein
VIRLSNRFAIVVAALLTVVPPAFAQNDDKALVPAEPDFTVVNLPTSLRLPVWGKAFRFTHRFTRPLKCDECDLGLLGDAFGLDDGAVIGLEFRIGLFPNGQLVVHRSRVNRAVQFLGEFGLTRQSASMPLEIAALVSIEGTQNFSGNDIADAEYSPAVGAVFTRMFGDKAAIHIDPIFVTNSNITPNSTGDDTTFALGIGGRVEIRNALYIVGEITPSWGYSPRTSLASFGIEKRLGGHMFQLNFSNNFGTTMRQIATDGGQDGDRWYLGFNITRKFF